MLSGKSFDDSVYRFWADRFDCERDLFHHSGTHVILEEELSGSGKIILYSIDQAAVVRLAPELASELKLAKGQANTSTTLSVSEIQSRAGGKTQAKVTSTLLDTFLDPLNFNGFPVEDEIISRRIDPENDQDILKKFYGVCTAEDLDAAEIYNDDPDPVIFGLFSDGQMVAYASHRYWGEVIADIGVLVHPQYRSRGLGKSVVSVLCEWCFQHEIVPMYRVFSDHHHSRQVARALGFKEMVVIDSLQLTESTMGY
jgi:GNAT superfamily N-acetyltransferase